MIAYIGSASLIVLIIIGILICKNSSYCCKSTKSNDLQIRKLSDGSEKGQRGIIGSSDQHGTDDYRDSSI